METVDTAARVTGSADPEGEAPWSMQLVVRVERTDPPSRTAACEAAAMATVRLLAADEAAGEWRPAIERWTEGRIRKHVRRARGAKWEKVQALDGVTVEHDGAQVRAFVPCPTDQVPVEVAKLQLSGTDLDDPAPFRRLDPVGSVLVVSLPPEPALPVGKAAAACGHGAQVAWLQMPDRVRRRWAADGFPVQVEHPSVTRFMHLCAAAPVVIRDAGFTEVAPGTVTAVGRWT